MERVCGPQGRRFNALHQSRAGVLDQRHAAANRSTTMQTTPLKGRRSGEHPTCGERFFRSGFTAGSMQRKASQKRAAKMMSAAAEAELQATMMIPAPY